MNPAYAWLYSNNYNFIDPISFFVVAISQQFIENNKLASVSIRNVDRHSFNTWSNLSISLECSFIVI